MTKIVEMTECCCGTAYYCSEDCKNIDAVQHGELCGKATKKKCTTVVDKQMIFTINNLFVHASFSGKVCGKNLLWGTVTIDSDKVICRKYEGQVASRKSKGEIIGVFHGFGISTMKSGTVHMGQFVESVRHGLGFQLQYTGNSISGTWESGKILIVNQSSSTAVNGYLFDVSNQMVINNPDLYWSVHSGTVNITSGQRVFDYSRKQDFIGYEVKGGDRSLGQFVIKKQSAVKHMRSKILDCVYRDSDWYKYVCIIWGDKSDGSDENPGIESILSGDFMIVESIGKGCVLHGERAFMQIVPGQEYIEKLLTMYEHSYLIDFTMCECMVSPIRSSCIIKDTETVVDIPIVRKIKRGNVSDTSDTDSSSDNESRSPSPCVRGMSTRDMIDYSGVETVYNCNIDKMISANKWVFLRKNKHLIYTRKVVVNGEVSSQKLVCPSTPSDRRSCKNILKNIKNLNRGVERVIEK